MLLSRYLLAIALLVPAAFGLPIAISAQKLEPASASLSIAVAPQYDSTHVYVAPSDFDAFATSFLGTFGGTSTRKVSVTVTPTASTTFSQLLQTPAGTVSVFGFTTPIPFPFGAERTGYMVTDMDAAIAAAKSTGADVVVTPFPDAIGMDAIIQWPGGVMTQIYTHRTKPSYPALAHVPENRVYLSADRADAFVKSFLAFSAGRVVRDTPSTRGNEIGLPKSNIRRIEIESNFGKLLVFVTDGHLPYPYGRETTGYEVGDLAATLRKSTALGVKILVPPTSISDSTSAMVQFPGGYIAEIHSRP